MGICDREGGGHGGAVGISRRQREAGGDAIGGTPMTIRVPVGGRELGERDILTVAIS